MGTASSSHCAWPPGQRFNWIDLLVTPDPLFKPGLRFVPVYDYEQVLVVNRQHPLSQSKHVMPEQLAGEVSFSGSLLQIASAGYQGPVAYQRSNANDTAYVCERSYDPKTGAFNFSAKASSGGVAYFGFSFSSDSADSGSARFRFELEPAVPGAPKVSINCAVPI